MNRRMLVSAFVLLSGGPVAAQELPPPSPHTPAPQWRQLARSIYEELVEINTAVETGSTTEAAQAVAKRLLAEGFPAADVQVLGPHPRKGNLVARLRGQDKQLKPLLLLAHIDVVEAKRADWSFDPYEFREEGGYFYGRGTADDKAMAAIFTANLIRMKREGIVPSRDIILALTADEEGGDHNGVDWLLKNHRPLVAAAYGLNEGGGGQSRGRTRLLNAVQASEKVYVSYHFDITNRGGHSSRPRKDNAIYELAEALTRVARFQFPHQLNEITRGYFAQMSKVEQGQLARDMAAVARVPADSQAIARLSEHPLYNGYLRTTCVATMLSGGHAENALPQLARATVNCRVLPGEDPEAVRKTLERVVANEKLTITELAPAKPSQPSPLTREVMGPIERITQEMWPGVPVVPTMTTGATDGLFFRNAGIPIYGVSGIFSDIDDSRAHGRDERMPVQSFYEGQEFLWRLVRALTASQSAT
jgi:acetylornithine deacetylase/succinyl-diaminopimelate desuccinylase-like protein